MAYDPVKAHEYYVNYRKKGLKKGRKKAAAKPTYKKTFLGVSISGLNDEGRIKAALIKENIQNAMKEALEKAKDDDERQEIRLEYSRKAQQAISALKADSKYAKPKATKAKTSTAKAKTAKITKPKAQASSGKKTKSKAAKVTKAKKEKAPETETETTKQPRILKKNEYHSPAKVIQKTEVKEKYESTGALLQKLETLANSNALETATQEQKFAIKDLVNSIIGKLQTQMNSGDVTKIKELIENLSL